MDRTARPRRFRLPRSSSSVLSTWSSGKTIAPVSTVALILKSVKLPIGGTPLIRSSIFNARLARGEFAEQRLCDRYFRLVECRKGRAILTPPPAGRHGNACRLSRLYVFPSALITRIWRWHREHTPWEVSKPSARRRPSVIIVVGWTGTPRLEARHSAQR